MEDDIHAEFRRLMGLGVKFKSENLLRLKLV